MMEGTACPRQLPVGLPPPSTAGASVQTGCARFTRRAGATAVATPVLGLLPCQKGGHSPLSHPLLHADAGSTLSLMPASLPAIPASPPPTPQEPVVGSIAPVSDRSYRTTAARIEPRFQIYSVAELPNETTLPFLIHGVLPAGALAEVHGSPGAGKSFLALDMALSISTGLPFFGHDVVSGQVLYVAAERFLGLRRRIEALCHRYAITDRSALHIMRDGVQLIDKHDVRSFVVALERLPVAPSLIVLDTLSRCLVGADENGQRDMSKVVEGIDEIRAATGATVLLVHHTRKAGDMERGSTVLRGAADLMMGVQKEKDIVSLRVEKVNDFTPFQEMKFRFDAEDSSCVLVQAELEKEEPEQPYADFLRGDLRRLLEALNACADGATQAELADRTGIPTSTVNRRVNEKLTPAGLVEKGERGGKCRLTDLGRQVLG